MNAYDLYKAESARIDLIGKSLGIDYLTDEGVDAENMCLPDGTMWPIDNSEEFWQFMFFQLHASVGMRLDDLGLKASDFGIDY